MPEPKQFYVGDRVKIPLYSGIYLIGTVNAVNWGPRQELISVLPDDRAKHPYGSGPNGGFTALPDGVFPIGDWSTTLGATKSSLSRLRHGGRIV